MCACVFMRWVIRRYPGSLCLRVFMRGRSECPGQVCVGVHVCILLCVWWDFRLMCVFLVSLQAAGVLTVVPPTHLQACVSAAMPPTSTKP